MSVPALRDPGALPSQPVPMVDLVASVSVTGTARVLADMFQSKPVSDGTKHCLLELTSGMQNTNFELAGLTRPPAGSSR